MANYGDEKFVVGDEVTARGLLHTYIVTKITETKLTLLRKDGTAYHPVNDGFIATGRHFDIESLLDSM